MNRLLNAKAREEEGVQNYEGVECFDVYTNLSLFSLSFP